MIRREVLIRKVSGTILAVSAVLAVAMAVVFGANYLHYLRWTAGARASLVSASIEPYADIGRLAMDVESESPAVGYESRIDSVEFTLVGDRKNLGHYRVIIPEGGASWDPQGTKAEVSLLSDIPIEHWPDVRESRSVGVEATLVMRLYLPGRDVPARIGLSGIVDMEAVR